MAQFPHHYLVQVSGSSTDSLTTTAENLPNITTAPPSQFGGPGDLWSPEDLFMASIANCFVLSFRALAKAANLEWNSIECESKGELDKIERRIQFTNIYTEARLHVAAGTDIEEATKLLHKAESICLISNSISCQLHLNCEVLIEE